ncbi:MAG: hypothetical protein H7Z37_06655 [Pyrinomonadaceae bacterium]|nr:hypothetical protein [Pyrinomonadaceae bacterium]
MLIEILCKSSEELRRSEISEFIKDGVYFGEELVFIPSDSSPEMSDVDWNTLEVQYQKGKKPIIIERYTEDIIVFTEICSEKLVSIKESGDKDFAEFERCVTKTKQIFVLAFDAVSIDEDCWAMLDSLESFITGKLEGMIFSDEGIYNEKLKRVFEFNKTFKIEQLD